VESALGTRVYNEYGCAEFGTIAHECEAGSLHVAAENMTVEVMDGERPCGENEPGELVITELGNRAMPLIRYRTGDIGAIASSPCSCGRQLPVLRSIEGRAWDMLERKDGQFFHPAFFLYIFEDAKERNLGIEHYKVYQTSVDAFFIQLIPGSNYSREAAEGFIRGEIQRKFDADARVEFQLVNAIPREKPGKQRQVVG
jgi:phenylacetate-CoA ligase